MSRARRQVILAITGASGAALGIRTLELLRETGCETHLIISEAARKTIQVETGWSLADVQALANYCYETNAIGSRIASGSFITEGMLVVPCSIKTLSGIAHSYADDLIVRAADVCLKEGRKVILALRETPLHLGHIRLMERAAESGAILFPVVPTFYAAHQTLAEILTDLAGRILLRMGIENDAYSHWDGMDAEPG
jgi:flavin prenyltransferase